MVHPNYDTRTIAVDKAIERVQEEYLLAVKANKLELRTLEVEIELYNKKARVNQLEMEMFANHRRFEIFV
jgi:hypothetical protein